LPANTDSRGIGINDHDQIVGNYYDNDTPTTHPFLYSDGHLTNIGALPGDATAQAVAINNLGQVLGMSGSAESPFLYDHGSIYPVFGLGGSSVAGLNDEDEIVGYGSQGGFVYANGNTTVLSTTILLDSGWSYLNPLAINNSGQITGTGLHNGQSRVFLLTPLFPHPTPTSPPVPTPTGTPTVTATPLPAPTTAPRAVTLTFSTGWSLVALPLVPDSPLSAYGLLTSVQSSGGSFAELASWNGVGWVTAIDSGGSLQGSDLPITQTQGYFLYTDAPATYVLSGRVAGS
jgi:probable HAF family extracellular repeat protein